jgi:hypothetical protein
MSHSPLKETTMMVVCDDGFATALKQCGKLSRRADLRIFVVEDDTQNGADHVDGHRSIFLAISPWPGRG